MKLLEYQAKEVIGKYGIKFPEGVLLEKFEPSKIRLPCVVKAQIPAVKRKEMGAVFVARGQEDLVRIEKLFGRSFEDFRADKVLIIPLESDPTSSGKKDEMYVSFSIDYQDANFVFLFTKQGGEVVEKTGKGEMVKASFDDFSAKMLEKKLKGSLGEEHMQKFLEVSEKLFRIMLDCDATLVEVNPLVLAGEEFYALDPKIIIDDNALFRHKEFASSVPITAIEREAREYGFSYVELEGDVGVICNGAGLTMFTLDMINSRGLRASNFLDLGGGAEKERMKKAIEIVLRKPEVKVIFMNIFAGITRCDDIALAINELEINKPLVLRLVGTNEKEAISILKKGKAYNRFGEALDKLVETYKQLRPEQR